MQDKKPPEPDIWYRKQSSPLDSCLFLLMPVTLQFLQQMQIVLHCLDRKRFWSFVGILPSLKKKPKPI